MKGPTAALPQHPNLANSSINIFNGNNANTNVNNTSNILHRHIFSNAHAGLPLTLFIGMQSQHFFTHMDSSISLTTGKIPLDFEDGRLAKMLDVCNYASFCYCRGI